MTDTITNRYSVAAQPPAVGQKVRAYGIPGFSAYEGTVVTVTKVDPYAITAEFPSQQKPDDTIELSFTQYEEVLERHEDATITPTVADVSGPIDRPDGHHSDDTYTSEYRLGAALVTVPALANNTELRAIITTLSNELSQEQARSASANTQVQSLRDTVSQAHRAIEIIGENLINEANSRGWCDEYDRIVDEINASLPGPFALPDREQEYEIEVTVSGTISTTTYVMVSARSEEDAREMVSENADDYISDADDLLTSAARTESFDDIEIEVQ